MSKKRLQELMNDWANKPGSSDGVEVDRVPLHEQELDGRGEE